MKKIYIDIILYIFEAVIFIYYCNNVFNSKFNKYIKCLSVFTGFTILFFIYQLGLNYINGITIILVSFLLMHYIYDAKFLNALLQSVLYLAFMIAGEYLVIPITNLIFDLNNIDLHNELHSYLFAVIVSKVIHFLCLMLMLIFFKRKKVESIDDNKGFALILTLPLSNIVVLTYIEYISQKIQYNTKTNIIWFVIALFMLFTNFLVFYNRSNILKQSQKINELNVENQKRELDEQYFSIIEKSNNDMKILAHDFKNHLIQINSFDNIEEVNSYIRKIYDDVEKFTHAGISGNKYLDVILSKYFSLCELKGIDFKVDVKTANLIQIDGYDLTALLNNLLDNAVEAAEISNEKSIEFDLLSESNYYDKLVIINSCAQMPYIQDKKLITNKEKNKSSHGFGLKSIKRIIEKYNGDYYWEYNDEDKKFITSILLPKERQAVLTTGIR